MATPNIADLNPILEETRRLLEGLMVECPDCEDGIVPHCDAYDFSMGKDHLCENSGCIRGYIPNPRYDLLRLVVLEKCNWCGDDAKKRVRLDEAEIRWGFNLTETVDEPCESCKGTGYIIRPWQRLRKEGILGAFAGAIEAIVFECPDGEHICSEYVLLGHALAGIFSEPDPDIAAAEALNRALKEVADAAN